jgi:hypothetical protein
MSKFNKGDAVEQILQAPVKGVVGGFNVDQESGAVLVRVDWTDEDGHEHQKFFQADQIKAQE